MGKACILWVYGRGISKLHWEGSICLVGNG
jgi:hypothetical protein